jgi:hypothetical protein
LTGRKQRPRLEAIDAGVDLVKLSFFGRRVLLFDDALEAPFRIAHDAPVAGRIVKAHAQERAGRAVPAMRAVLVDERAERLRAHERHVAGEHEQS